VEQRTLAASRATATFAHADAALQLTEAVRLLVQGGEAGTPTHFELLHALGRAHWRAGHRDQAVRAFDDAWSLAEQLDDPERAARAAVGGGFSCDFAGEAASARADRCRATLRRLPTGDGATRARLLAELAASLVVHSDRAEARRTAVEARDMARRVDDPVALGYALVAEQFTSQSPARLSERLDDAREIIALSKTTGERPLEVLGRFCLIGAMLEAADPMLDREISAQAAEVRHLNEPGYRRHDVWFECMRSLLRGRVGEANRLAKQGLELALAAGDPDAYSVYGGQAAVALWMQGRATETEEAYLAMRAAEPDTILWTAVLAGLYGMNGRPGDAAMMLDDICLRAVPRDQHTLLTWAAMTEGAIAARHRSMMGELREELELYAERITPVAMGVACWDPVARLLGVLSLALGDVDRGIAELQLAVEVCARVDARPWLAVASLELAEAQLRHGRTTAATPELIEQGSALASTIGIPRLIRLAADLRA